MKERMVAAVSTAALMLVRDEADIIGYTLDHLMEQVDRIFVLDNRSADGTSDILGAAAGVTVYPDPEVGYWQERKMTMLARRAHELGYGWVVPVDADELWLPPDGKTLAGTLAGTALDVQVVGATIVNHVPTGDDDVNEPNPFRRIGWRQPETQELGKVACRTHKALTIHAGNHEASYGSLLFNQTAGFRIRHYPWRSEEQYVRKIRNGEEAYAATNLHSATGAHWRMWADHPDDAIVAQYRQWFHEQDPPGIHELVYDPAVT